ncbi:MAG: hypothetical protein DID89_2727547637 [Candidatus Nitrotoga sp. CP45]|nr:MAG: hypothetical protein DID89_2727547637 [Candidatus Nitrotoga sp. CP45]
MAGESKVEASPKELHMTGFALVTIAAIIATGLLIGIASCITAKYLFHIVNGAPLHCMFEACYTLKEKENEYN